MWPYPTARGSFPAFRSSAPGPSLPPELLSPGGCRTRGPVHATPAGCQAEKRKGRYKANVGVDCCAQTLSFIRLYVSRQAYKWSRQSAQDCYVRYDGSCEFTLTQAMEPQLFGTTNLTASEHETSEAFVQITPSPWHRWGCLLSKKASNLREVSCKGRSVPLTCCQTRRRTVTSAARQPSTLREPGRLAWPRGPGLVGARRAAWNGREEEPNSLEP